MKHKYIITFHVVNQKRTYGVYILIAPSRVVQGSSKSERILNISRNEYPTANYQYCYVKSLKKAFSSKDLSVSKSISKGLAIYSRKFLIQLSKICFNILLILSICLWTNFPPQKGLRSYLWHSLKRKGQSYCRFFFVCDEVKK